MAPRKRKASQEKGSVDPGIIELFKGILEAQAEAYQRGLQAVLEKVVEPSGKKEGTVGDFRLLMPKEFAGTEGALQADEWIKDMENLVNAARISEQSKVDVVKLQLQDVARTWWEVEEVRCEKPISWRMFKERFYEKFFPETVQSELMSEFIKLRQESDTVEVYAANFTRLSKFAPTLVSTEVDRAQRFQQGLDWDIQQNIAAQRYQTYEDVLGAALRSELVAVRKKRELMEEQRLSTMNVLVENPRPAEREASVVSQTSSSLALPIASVQSSRCPVECFYCHKPGHVMKDCRKARRNCYACGGVGHLVSQCDKFSRQQ